MPTNLGNQYTQPSLILFRPNLENLIGFGVRAGSDKVSLGSRITRGIHELWPWKATRALWGHC